MNTLKLIFFVLVIGFCVTAVGQDRPENAPGASPDQAKQVKLYPNPAIEFLTVKFETPQAKTAKLVLHNIIGNELETEAEVIDEYEVKIKVKDLSSGFYLLLIKNETTGLKGAYKFLKK
jgi:hypothetical protein